MAVVGMPSVRASDHSGRHHLPMSETAAISIPDPSLVVLIGAAGSGKSTFAARHFADQEILSSDAFREQIAGDPADQRATGAAFAALHRSLARRLVGGRLTVVDATNVQSRARRPLLGLAAGAGLPAIAIVLDLPASLVLARNAARSARVVPEAAVRRQLADLRLTLRSGVLASEGFASVVRLSDPATVDAVTISRVGA
jgi:protein phosphatase